MRVLVACEFSGVVRDEFRRLGHDAWSCDLLPSDMGGCHIQGDVMGVLGDGWDVMIAHPPCTYLTVSANRWFEDQPERRSGVLVGEARRVAREQAVEFVLGLWECGIPKIAIENPVGVLSTRLRKPDQVIQPWMFGHGETKATCVWLKGLPVLKPTCVVGGREQRIHRLPKSPDRWRLRSITYSGVAEAMAKQWGGV